MASKVANCAGLKRPSSPFLFLFRGSAAPTRPNTSSKSALTPATSSPVKKFGISVQPSRRHESRCSWRNLASIAAPISFSAPCRCGRPQEVSAIHLEPPAKQDVVRQEAVKGEFGGYRSRRKLRSLVVAGLDLSDSCRPECRAVFGFDVRGRCLRLDLLRERQARSAY